MTYFVSARELQNVLLVVVSWAIVHRNIRNPRIGTKSCTRQFRIGEHIDQRHVDLAVNSNIINGVADLIYFHSLAGVHVDVSIQLSIS